MRAKMLDRFMDESRKEILKIVIPAFALILAIAFQIWLSRDGLENYMQVYLSLYYLPMILVSYYYPKYGPFQALLIGSVPFVVAYLLFIPGVDYAIPLLLWLIFFVIIGWMISFLVIQTGQNRTILEDMTKDLQDSKELLGTALWGAGLGVWEEDLIEGGEAGDARWRALMGYSPKDDLPRDLFQTHVHPEFLQKYQDTEALLKNGSLDNSKMELKLYRKTGEEMWARIYLNVKHSKDGQVSKIVGILEDITSSIVQQMAVISANEKLNILSSITRDDILNEITSVQGYLGLIDLDGYILPDTKSYDYLKKVNDSIENIMRQMEFTRQYQDIGAKAPEWNNIPEKIKKMVVRPEFQELNVTVDCPIEVLGDPLFMNVFFNLFENSIKHGGHVKQVDISYGHGQKEGVIVYQDDGTGIADSMKERIFDRGYGSGTGYGLFVSKEILELTDMKIKEVGVEGKGARFEIAIPLANIRRLK